MKNKQAFTLIELLVGITISIVLMVGVSMFVSSGIQNILTQDKVLSNYPDVNIGLSALQKSISNIKTLGSFSGSYYGSGALFLSSGNIDSTGLTYIGSKSFSGEYCESDSDEPNTNHLIIKQFIPFEAIGADIISSTTNYDNNNIETNYFSGTLLKSGVAFNGEYYAPTDVYLDGNDLYVSDTANHSIMLFDYTDTTVTGSVVAGRGIPGDNFSENMSATGAFLNNPIGLTMADGKLLFSDTLNNRILYLSGTQLFSLLDESDGLDQPTGLYYDDPNTILYISNSGKGEVLTYGSNSSSKTADFSFNIPQAINNLQRLDIQLLPGVTDISSPSTPGDISFNNITKYTDYLTGSNDTLSYYFSNFSDNFDTQVGVACTINYSNYSIDGSGDIIRDVMSGCSGTGTLRKYKTSSYQNISSGTTVDISSSGDFTGTDIDNNGNYYAQITFHETSGSQYNKYLPFYVNSDSSIFTKDDNTLSILVSGAGYPTGIGKSGNVIRINDSLYREQIRYNLSTSATTINPAALNNFSYGTLSGLPYNQYSDRKIPLVIKDFQIEKNGDLVSADLEYYKSFNCYNSDQNSSSGATSHFYIQSHIE